MTLRPSADLAGLGDEAVLAVFVDPDRSRGAREAAFRELVDRFQRRVFAVCRRTLPDDGDAEEATQEVFVRLAGKAATFRGDAKLSTWLYAVARNVATDRVRYEVRRPATPVEDVAAAAGDGGPQVADEVAARETGLDVGRALQQLDEISRELLWLVAVEGLSYAEAGAATDLAVGTVKSRVSRARVQLGRLLEVGDPDAGPPSAARGPAAPSGAERDPARGPRGPPAA